MPQSSVSESDAGPQYRHLRRTKGYSTAKGFEYEYKMAGLLYVRAMNKKLDCEVFLNVDEMEPGGDIVVNIMKPHHSVICVQQKLREKEVELSLQEFLAASGKYSIKSYYKVFQKLNQACSQNKRIKCKPEQLRMIIFTTKKKSDELHHAHVINAQIAAERNSNQSTVVLPSQELGFNIEELFSTKEDNNAFSFGSEEKKVWNLMNDKPDEIDFYRNIFLPRFIVFSDQSTPDTLDKILERVLQERFKSLPHLRLEKMTKMFLEKLKVWAEDRNEEKSVGHAHGPFAKTLAAILRPSPEPINDVHLCFEDFAIDEVLEALRPSENQNTKRVLVLIEDVPPPLHRVKIIQALRRGFPDRWILIEDTDLRDFPEEALQFACGACNVIVIESCNEDTLDRLLKIANKGKATAVLLRRNSDAHNGLEHMLHEWEQNTIQAPWKLNHFTPQTQDAIMNLKITFQGQSVKLSDLQETWRDLKSEANGELLATALQGRLTIGEELTTDYEETT